MATAPFCNVTVTAPGANPTSPHGFQLLAPNATLQDVINAINNNFSPQAMEKFFNDMLDRALGPIGNNIPRNKLANGGTALPLGGGFRVVGKSPNNKIGEEIDRRLGMLMFTVSGVKRKKIKVVNPEDSDDWVIDERVQRMVMTDDRTGAQWIFNE